MTYRNLFFSGLMSMFCFISLPMLAGMMPNMEDFEKELLEANRAIEEYVASLSPEEQAAFNKQVEEFSQLFENMSEDEFEQFLGEMFADEPMMMEPNPFDVPQPTPQEEVVEVVLSTEDKKKAETALAVLDDIIKQSNLFMVMINSSSDLPNRINQWAKKGDLLHWQSGADWVAFKLELDTFIQKLYKAEEQDLTTKKYKYLLELIADESLYNNLIQLQTELKKLIPTIEIPEFSIQKLSSDTKKAIKNVLGTYTESFYLLGTPKALDTLFEKYAPEEEKIRTAEEAANKRSLEASRMTRTPAGETHAGMDEDMGYGDYGYGYDNYYGGGYGSPYGYDNYGYDNYGGYSPDYGSYGSDYGTGRSNSGGRSGGGSGSSGSRGESDSEKSKKDKEDEDKKDKKSKPARFIPNYDVELAFADIKSNFKDINSLFVDEEENKTKLADIASHLNDDKEVNVILAGATLPTVEKKLTAIYDDLKKINEKVDDKKLKADELSYYQKEINKFFDDNKKEVESLRTGINSFEEKTDEQKEAAKKEEEANPSPAEKPKKTDISDLSEEKRWAYFGKEVPGIDEKLQEAITSKVSLFDIRSKITDIFDELKKFMSKKIAVPKKKAETPKESSSPDKTFDLD